MIDTVLFDLDGTLLDSLADITDTANLMLKNYQIEPKSQSEIKKCIGDGLINLIERIMPENSDEKLINEALLLYRSIYAKNKFNKTMPYDGILNLLEKIKQAGMKIGVVTNKKEPAAKELTNEYFHSLIDITVGDDSIRPLKPDPAPIKFALDKLNCINTNAMFVGDSEVDIKAAQNAGVLSVGVTWGYRDKKVLIEHKADILIDRPVDLMEHLLTKSIQKA